MALMPAGRVVSRWFEPLWRSEWMKGRLQHLGNKTDDRPVAAFCIDLYEFPNEADALPRVSVSYDEAAALCRANGKRLCKEDEWERACAGNEGWDYAYGETKDPSRCNTESRVGEVKDLAPASKFPDCKSPIGVYFLDGNVSEWVEATRDLTGAEQAIRGGTLWVADYGQSCYSRHTHDRDTRWNDDGFRCCADVAE
jgi:formylglycine-generating enzyme required for sulfatase activity